MTSYSKLLDAFWAAGPQCQAALSRQYRHAVWYGSDEQKDLAEKAKIAAEKHIGKKVTTDVEPLGVFTLAEDYHQKYYLRSTPLWREYTAIYPKMAELLGSTAVSRVNGYMTAFGASATLEREIDQLGLSAAGEAWLRKRVR